MPRRVDPLPEFHHRGRGHDSGTGGGPGHTGTPGPGFRGHQNGRGGLLEIAAGPTADHRTYGAEYPYAAFEVTVRGRPVTVEAGSITVEAQLGLWPYRDLLTDGAGVYAAESGTLTVTALRARRKIELEFEPDRYRRAVHVPITRVS